MFFSVLLWSLAGSENEWDKDRFNRGKKGMQILLNFYMYMGAFIKE